MQKKTRILEIQQLVEWFKKGKKIKKNWRVGTEHEKFAYNFSNLKNSYYPTTYESKNGIRDFLNELSNFGWEKVLENGNVISLKKQNQSITLEPGGQIELSGAPLKDNCARNHPFYFHCKKLQYQSFS